MSRGERSSLLERRRQSNYNSLGDFPELPSTGDIRRINNSNNISAPATLLSPGYPSTPSIRDDRHGRFKLFNKRLGSYDEDRQGLIKENTGLRVWYESYSTIGKKFAPGTSHSTFFTIMLLFI